MSGSFMKKKIRTESIFEVDEVKNKDDPRCKHLTLQKNSTCMAFAVFSNDKPWLENLEDESRSDVFMNALFVHMVQGLMIYCVWVYVGEDDSGFQIRAANGLDMIIARFVASMMMHINCEKDIRNGINMMKYSVNHHERFTNVYATFFIALLSTIIAFITEINVMLILSSLPNILGVVMKYVSLAAISKIPGFYYESLIEHKLLQAGGMKMKIINYRKD